MAKLATSVIMWLYKQLVSRDRRSAWWLVQSLHGQYASTSSVRNAATYDIAPQSDRDSYDAHEAYAGDSVADMVAQRRGFQFAKANFAQLKSTGTYPGDAIETD